MHFHLKATWSCATTNHSSPSRPFHSTVCQICLVFLCISVSKFYFLILCYFCQFMPISVSLIHQSTHCKSVHRIFFMTGNFKFSSTSLKLLTPMRTPSNSSWGIHIRFFGAILDFQKINGSGIIITRCITISR